jgi:hypothetical protein
MMRWFILVLVVCFLALLIAAGAMLLHVRRQRRKLLESKDTDPQVEVSSSEENTLDS